MTRSVLFQYQLTSAGQLSEVSALCERQGLERLWLTQSLGIDVWSAIASVADTAPKLSFGTAVTLMPLYHPLELASRLRAMAEMLPGRFTAGLGVSEPAVVTEVFGGRSPTSPLTYSREYVEILRASLVGKPTEFRGDYFELWTNDLRDRSARESDLPRLMLGALGPKMAGLAGNVADGCITWLAPPALLDHTIVPELRKTAVKPEQDRTLVALVPCIPLRSFPHVCRFAEHVLGAHLEKPHYRRMLARVSSATRAMSLDEIVRFVVHNVVAWGSPADIGERLREYDDAGADEIAVAAYSGDGLPSGFFQRTLELVASQ